MAFTQRLPTYNSLFSFAFSGAVIAAIALTLASGPVNAADAGAGANPVHSAQLFQPSRAAPGTPETRAPAPHLFKSTAIPAINLPVHEAVARVADATTGAGCAEGCLQLASAEAAVFDRPTLQAVNSAVNAAIRYARDADLYGEPEYWATAAEAFRKGAGDCEDIAIAKMAVLTAMGADPRDLYLAVVRDTRRKLMHAVLAVRSGGDFFILDNVRDQVRSDRAVADYRPLYSVSAQGAWVHGVRLAQRRRVGG